MLSRITAFVFAAFLLLVPPVHHMGINNLYGPQAFTAGPLSWGDSPAYRSSNALVTSWTDAPISGYPEVWLMEDVTRVLGAGPNGENVMRCVSAAKSGVAGIGFGGMGTAARGQWEVDPTLAGGNFTVEWDQEFRTDYWATVDYAQLMFLGQDFDSNQDGAVDFGSQAVFIEMQQTTGNGFYWSVSSQFTDTGSSFLGNQYYANQTASFSVDDQWRTIKLVIIPSTYTGTLGSGLAMGSASFASDGSITMYVKSSTAPNTAYVQEFSLTGLKFTIDGYNTTHSTYARGVSFGEATMVGGITNLHLYWQSPDTVTAPPMQRASYVLFSNEIVEKQTQVDLAKTYFQLLVTDPPPSVTPDTLTLVTITGHVYDQNGNIRTQGRFYMRPQKSIQVSSTYLINTATITYDIPGSGDISMQLAPSNGVRYFVEFDPDPADTSKPMQLKTGYWRDYWLVPNSGPVDIASL